MGVVILFQIVGAGFVLYILYLGLRALLNKRRDRLDGGGVLPSGPVNVAPPSPPQPPQPAEGDEQPFDPGLSSAVKSVINKQKDA